MRGVPVLVLLGAVMLGIGGYLAGRAHNRKEPPHSTTEPTPPSGLRPLGTPKDLCCCRILGDGQTNLSEALENYAKAKSRSDHKWACLYASCAVDEYNRVVNGAHPSHADIAYLEHWREIEKAECAAGGFIPRQHG
jgi:hypothetical protein